MNGYFGKSNEHATRYEQFYHFNNYVNVSDSQLALGNIYDEVF
jgi:hypothetical protein